MTLRMNLKRLVVSVAVVVSSFAFAESAGGLSWSAPKSWTASEPRPMRAATYVVPAAKGETEAGECAVFFFGSGQGGGVDENVKRWVSQFDAGNKSSTRKEKVNGLEVTRVEVEGTYQSGGMAGPKVAKPGTKLLGAIVEGKGGNVFFKFTGSAKTVEAAKKDFDAVVASIKG
jgi:hypothetical protein